MKVKPIASGLAQFAITTFAILLPLPLFARCPISPNGMLVVRAPAGNVQVELSGSDAIEVDVSDKQIHVQESCGADNVVLEGNDIRTNGIPQWRIRAPKGVKLDIVASAGGITLMGDSDAPAVVLRTGGGPVTVGNIKGQTTIVTQGSYIKAGNIGGAAELRSIGNLDVGSIAGDAVFQTSHGAINANVVGGKVTAETRGGKINIAEARGVVQVLNTQGGDISINDANGVQVRTEGGSIHSRRVHGGGFKGDTAAGDIYVDQGLSWVEASTGQGKIEVRLVGDNLNGDRHVNLRTENGNIILYLPERLRASIEAGVMQSTFTGKSIVADFALNDVIQPSIPAVRSGIGVTTGLANTAFRQTWKTAKLNGGGNPVKLHTGFGSITIKIN
jgi:hypothetical protein